MRLASAILGVDRQSQRFDRRQVQIGHLAGVLLPGVDPSYVDAIRSIGDARPAAASPMSHFGVEVHQDQPTAVATAAPAAKDGSRRAISR